MLLNELLPTLQTMSRTDKLRLLQFLVFELAQEENIEWLEPNVAYPIWTPYNAFEAADTLLKVLEAEKDAHDGS